MRGRPKGSGLNQTPEQDEVTTQRMRQKFTDDAKALVVATQSHRDREKELLERIAQLEKENRALMADAALSLVSRTHALPAGCYREQVADPKRTPSFPRMASRNRAGNAPPPPRRSGASPRVQGRSRAAG